MSQDISICKICNFLFSSIYSKRGIHFAKCNCAPLFLLGSQISYKTAIVYVFFWAPCWNSMICKWYSVFEHLLILMENVFPIAAYEKLSNYNRDNRIQLSRPPSDRRILKSCQIMTCRCFLLRHK